MSKGKTTITTTSTTKQQNIAKNNCKHIKKYINISQIWFNIQWGI